MYRIGFAEKCPQVIGADTWNPVTGECGPGPSSDVIPATGYLYQPIVVTNPPFIEPRDTYDPFQPANGAPTQETPAPPEEKGNALLLLGIAAIAGIVLLSKRA